MWGGVLAGPPELICPSSESLLGVHDQHGGHGDTGSQGPSQGRRHFIAGVSASACTSPGSRGPWLAGPSPAPGAPLLKPPSLTKAGSPGRPGSPCGEGTEAEMGQTARETQGPRVSLPSPCYGVGVGQAASHDPPSLRGGRRVRVGPERGDSVSPGRRGREAPTAPTTVPLTSGPSAPGCPATPGSPWGRGGEMLVGLGTGSCGKWQTRAGGGEGLRGLLWSNSAKSLAGSQGQS